MNHEQVFSPLPNPTGSANVTPRRPNTANEATQNPQAGTRFISSCNRCRRRKIKCDTGIPSCHACAESNTACEYHDTTSNTALPRSRIIGLEQHLSYLLGQQYAGSSNGDPSAMQIMVDEVTQPAFRGRLVVSGIRLACTFCRKRKIKCDGTAPCAGCTKFGKPKDCSILCEEASSQGRSYISYLEDRIAKCERRSTSVGHESNDQLGSPRTTTNLGDTLANGDRDSAILGDEEAARALLSESPAKMASLSSELTNLNERSAAVLSNPSLHTPWDFKTSILSFLGYKDEAGPFTSTLNRALVQPLVHHYISKVSPALPFILVSDISRATDKLYARKASSDEQFMVLMIMAIATSHMSEHPSSMASWNALKLFSSASQVASYNPDTLVGLELTLLVIQFGTLNPSKMNVWYLSAIAMRACVSLGLHRDPSVSKIRPESVASTPDSLGPFTDDDRVLRMAHTRRRLFWAAYAFDRVLSITTGRPLAIDDEVITVSVPSSLPGVEADPASDFMIQRLSIYRIYSEVYSILHHIKDMDKTPADVTSVICNFEQRISQWYPRIGAANEALLISDICTTQILLYRPCPLIPRRSTEDLAKLAKVSIQYTDQLYDFVHGNSASYNSHFIITRIYTTGLSLMHACSSPDFDQSSLDVAMRSKVNLAVSKATSCLFGATAKWQVGLNLATKFVAIQGSFFTWLNSRNSSDSLPTEIRDFATYREGRLLRNVEDGAPDWDQVMHGLLSSAGQTVDHSGIDSKRHTPPHAGPRTKPRSSPGKTSAESMTDHMDGREQPKQDGLKNQLSHRPGESVSISKSAGTSTSLQTSNNVIRPVTHFDQSSDHDQAYLRSNTPIKLDGLEHHHRPLPGAPVGQNLSALQYLAHTAVQQPVSQPAEDPRNVHVPISQ